MDELSHHLDARNMEIVEGMLNTKANFSEYAATEIMKILIEENHAGQESLKKKRFIEVFSFLFIDEPYESEKHAQEVAEEKAERLWRHFINEGYILAKGFVFDKESIIKELQSVRVGNRSVVMQAAMNKEELYDITWADNSKRYFHEFVDVVKDAGGSWFSYVKNKAALVYSIHDPAHLDIIKKRDRLIAMRDAVKADYFFDGLNKSVLHSVEQTPDILERAIEQLTKLREDKDALEKEIKPTIYIGDSVEQARILLEANLYVIEALRAGHGWDTLPNPIRQTSLWIAMNRGATPEAGLQLAKDFLTSYAAAPKGKDLYWKSY